MIYISFSRWHNFHFQFIRTFRRWRLGSVWIDIIFQCCLKVEPFHHPALPKSNILYHLLLPDSTTICKTGSFISPQIHCTISKPYEHRVDHRRMMSDLESKSWLQINGFQNAKNQNYCCGWKTQMVIWRWIPMINKMLTGDMWWRRWR